MMPQGDMVTGLPATPAGSSQGVTTGFMLTDWPRMEGSLNRTPALIPVQARYKKTIIYMEGYPVCATFKPRLLDYMGWSLKVQGRMVGPPRLVKYY